MMLVCHFHADESLAGQPTGDAEGSQRFTCTRGKGHPTPGPHSWFYVPEPPSIPGADGLAAEYNLAVELPVALAQFKGQWVEYGVVERAYALAQPDDFAALVERYGHTAIEARRYTVSSFLARTLGALSSQGVVLYHDGPATGRWNYNAAISWWALAPEPDWSARLAWADTGYDMSYVPGSIEA